MPKRSRQSGSKKPTDEDLWKSVTKTVTPIKSSNRQTAVATPVFESIVKPISKKPIPAATDIPPVIPVKKSQTARPPALSGFDRRTTQKFLRGNVDIDARIDLHGMTQQAAHGALKNFLNSAHQRGHRTVLVITGKGSSPFGHHTLHGRDYVSTPERTGILRNAISDWLKEDGFRQFVIGFQPAHPKHGGGGAFYVRLRRASSPRKGNE